MKLAEALLQKKELVARINNLNERISEAAVYPEGQEPEESASDLLVMVDEDYKTLEDLTVRINQTNNLVVLGEGSSVSVMQAIAKRDVLKSKIAIYGSIVASIRQRNRGGRYMAETTKMALATDVDVQGLIKSVDGFQRDLRVLDAAIQSVNWTTELI